MLLRTGPSRHVLARDHSQDTKSRRRGPEIMAAGRREDHGQAVGRKQALGSEQATLQRSSVCDGMRHGNRVARVQLLC